MQDTPDPLAVLAATPKRKFITSVKVANLTIQSLERKLEESRAELAALQSGAQPVKIRQATAPAAAALAAASTEIAPEKLTALAKHIFGVDAATGFEAQRLQFTRAGLIVPGLEPAPANPHFTPKFVGLARSVRSIRPEKVNAFFNPKP